MRILSRIPLQIECQVRHVQSYQNKLCLGLRVIVFTSQSASDSPFENPADVPTLESHFIVRAWYIYWAFCPHPLNGAAVSEVTWGCIAYPESRAIQCCFYAEVPSVLSWSTLAPKYFSWLREAWEGSWLNGSLSSLFTNISWRTHLQVSLTSSEEG